LWQIPGGSERDLSRAPRTARRLGVLTLAAGLAASACAGVRLGDTAPGFTLPDASGKKVSLADYKGKIVLLSFWATWCGPCGIELPELVALQREHPKEVVLLLVSDEDAATTGGYLKKQRLDATALRDEKGDVFDAYGVTGLPSLFVIDGDGRVRDGYLGYRSGQKERVAATLGSLLAP